jgi:epoxyqueuosine reductase
MVLPEAVTGLEAQIKAEAYRLGFCLCGITTPDTLEGFPRYENWLASGKHAGMKYLSTDFHRNMRQNPRLLMPGASSILCLAFPYPLHTPTALEQKGTFLTAGYVGGRDYHLVLPEKLALLVERIETLCGTKVEHRIFTDSAPVLERELAARAGLGWIGKNSCLISPKVGSAFLLAEVFLNLALVPDTPYHEDRCGSCQRCVSACPTQCISPDRTIDARRCISYHTIENKEQIPQEIAAHTPPWLFGCDICQAVCPWNHNAAKDETSGTYTIAELMAFLEMDGEAFARKFHESAILRTRYSGWVRNVLINLASVEGSISQPALRNFLNHQADPRLRELAKSLLKQK